MTIEVLTGILVGITGFYAWTTYRIMQANDRVVKTMGQQIEAVTRPYVSVSFLTVPHSHMFHLRVANTGKTGAEAVRLTLDRDFFQWGIATGTNLRNSPAFQDTIHLPPGAEILFGLAMGPQLVGDQLNPALTPPVFKVTAEYSFGERRVTEVTTVDARPYRDSMRPPSAIVAELHGISEHVKKIAEK